MTWRLIEEHIFVKVVHEYPHAGRKNLWKTNINAFPRLKKGLKTGLLLLKDKKAAADAIKFTIVKEEKSLDKEEQQSAMQCSIDNQDDCEMCGS